jgi:hypothetical protein
MRKLPVVLLCRTASVLPKHPNHYHIRRIPPLYEGRYGQSSRNVRRGAVDASGARRCARGASDEAVWSRHPDAGVKLASKRCRPFGPDTPRLQATVTRTPGTPRRARYKSSNIARGMPGCPVVPVTARVRFLCYSAHEKRGCNGTRHSLRPRFSGGHDDASPGRKRAAGMTTVGCLKFESYRNRRIRSPHERGHWSRISLRSCGLRQRASNANGRDMPGHHKTRRPRAPRTNPDTAGCASDSRRDRKPG